MPIVEIEVVGGPDDPLPPSLAQGVADAAGPIFGTAPGGTWVRLRTLAATHYAESALAVAPDERPVFVTVTRRALPEREALMAEITALTEAIARILQRPPARVHVEYAPAAAGRIAFGGTLVE
jgi:phenylpyruvate tautomerase PptA (4-oxalocrotonate tautomerase family)